MYAIQISCILRLVLREPAKNIEEWRKQLPLLQVCRQWYEMLRSFVFSPGFVIIEYLHGSNSAKDNDTESCVRHLKVNTTRCVYYASDDFVCRSNLGIITGRDEHNCNYVTNLDVFISSKLDICRYSPVLKELLTLGVGYWLSLTSLKLTAFTRNNYNPKLNEGELKELALAVSKHIFDFKRNAPNITRLHLDCGNDKALSSALPILIDEYTGHLQYLRCYFAIKHIPSLFTDALTHLLLNLHKATTRIPYIYAKSLQSLELYRIPGTFSWWRFHDHLTPGYIEFTNMETLKLNYRSQTDEEKKLSIKYSKQNRPYGCHMLRFPKLSRLSLMECPVDCDVLFTDMIPTHIKRLYIYGTSDSIASVSRLQFSKIDELSIHVHDHTSSDDFYDAADYYFRKVGIVSRCELYISSAPNIQRASTWVNLTSLNLSNIGLEVLLRLIPNLYNLKILETRCISLGDETLSIIMRGLEEEQQERIDHLYTGITELRVRGVEPNSPRNFLVCINHLLVRMPTINMFQTTTDQRSTVSQSFLPEKFQNIVFDYVFDYRYFFNN